MRLRPRDFTLSAFLIQLSAASADREQLPCVLACLQKTSLNSSCCASCVLVGRRRMRRRRRESTTSTWVACRFSRSTACKSRNPRPSNAFWPRSAVRVPCSLHAQHPPPLLAVRAPTSLARARARTLSLSPSPSSRALSLFTPHPPPPRALSLRPCLQCGRPLASTSGVGGVTDVESSQDLREPQMWRLRKLTPCASTSGSVICATSPSAPSVLVPFSNATSPTVVVLTSFWVERTLHL